MANVVRVVDEIVEDFRSGVEQELRALARSVPEGGLGEIEERVGELRKRIDHALLDAIGRVLGNGYRGTHLPCACGGTMRYVNDRSRRILTMFGRLKLRRAYYHCGACRASRVPLDEVLGIQGEGQSVGVQATTALVCSLMPNGQAMDLLGELGIPHVSLSESQRITRAVGHRTVEWRDEEARRWAEAHEAPREHVQPQAPQRLAVSMDGTTAHTDGKYHEAKVGTFYAFDAEGEAVGQTAYVVTFEGVEHFRDLWDSEAQRWHMDRASVLVAIGDAAAWTWNTVAERCPAHVVEVLDFYHASEHLWGLARAIWGEGSRRAKPWVSEQEARLLEGHEKEFFEELRHWAAEGQPWSEEGQSQLNYFTTNADRIHYQLYRELGYPIGSGMVESACKTVVGVREKQPGMRWRKATAEAIAHLRAVYQSGRWRALRKRLIRDPRKAG